MDDFLWLYYKFNGWLFEFKKDEVFVTNPVNNYRYKIILDPYNNDRPFMIILESING